jgi:hypothetical protein
MRRGKLSARVATVYQAPGVRWLKVPAELAAPEGATA